MKKTILLFTVLLGISTFIFAQKVDFNPNKMEKIKQLRIAFISNRLNLDAPTAERFWPVFNHYSEEQKALHMERRNVMKNDANYTTNNTEAANAIDKMQDIEQRNLDLQKKYKVEFLKVISPSQLANLYASEKEFREKLMNRMKDRRGGRGEGGFRNNRRGNFQQDEPMQK